MDQREIWDDLVGNAWVRFADVLDAHSAPFGAAAMDALPDLDGAAVLDVGCGTGSTTLQLADRVGPAGRVIGVDLSEPMIERARARASDRPQVSFVVGDALGLTLATPADAIYSRFGVMFFDDPVAAFAHLRGLARDGGQIAFVAWQDPFSNPWMLVPVIASADVLGPPELPPPGAPGPFSLATPDVIRATLTGAGWSGVEINELSLESPFPGDAVSTATMVTQTNPVLSAGLRRVPEQRAALIEVVAAALRPHERDGAVVFQAAASIVTATSAS